VIDAEPASFRSYKNDCKTLREMEEFYPEEKENRQPHLKKKCKHRRSKERILKQTTQRSRSSMDHIPERSPILATIPTLDAKVSGGVKESTKKHLSSHSADVREASRGDLLMQMLARDPSVSSYNRTYVQSADQKGVRQHQVRHQLKVCEDYFRMIPEIQESQEKIIFGLKDEIQELDKEIKSL